MTTLTEARRRFAQERPDYRRLAADVEHELQQILAGAGVAGQVTGRAKDLHSFVSKSLRKGYTDPWTQTTDKAGVRITLTREAAIDIVVQLVTERYTVLEIQDKRRDLLREDKIGYMGVHVQVEVPGQDSVARQCEIQVRTAAQNLWAEMSHELLYKPEARPDAETGRALTRLAVYMETFDEEVNRRVTQLLAAPGYPLERLISAAEQEYYRFATAPGDRALSRRLLEGIGPALPADQDVAMYTRQLTALLTPNTTSSTTSSAATRRATACCCSPSRRASLFSNGSTPTPTALPTSGQQRSRSTNWTRWQAPGADPCSRVRDGEDRDRPALVNDVRQMPH